jgi:hypothetical protein
MSTIPFRLPTWISSVVPFGSHLNLPSKEESRIRTLVKNFQTNEPEIDPLALDLANNKAFSQVYGSKDGAKFDEWILRMHECNLKIRQCDKEKTSVSRRGCYRTNNDKCHLFDQSEAAVQSWDELEEAIYGLYYHAKNTDYLQQEYYDEMRRIEARRDFSRSIALIAFFFLVVALVLALARLVYSFIKYRIRRRKGKDGRKKAFRKRYFRLFTTRQKVNRRIAVIWLVLFVISFLGMWAYEKESDEFNKRAFGYYRSELVRQRNRTSTQAGGP